MLHGNDLHMAIDVVNDQQLTPMLSNHYYVDNMLNYAPNNDNINSDNTVDVDNDNSGVNDLNDMQKHYRTTRIIRRRKRFATAQTSRWDKMTSDNVLKLKWFISRYTRDIPRSEIRYFILQTIFYESL
ncbi:hypothetical protein LOAG_13082 [Loa loa]|uniref:Uncharacterized protein n=1 Tax=Loa loa TaxID=7209 RepID=A0A1S0TK46_LOALO|nr:hypothetical protein LOAG_13082 [Loa loa]EFO15427.1 hypothetical protein LOAG_13082 [Loa loa]